MATLNPEIGDFLAAAPKCEHHVHLEGLLDPDLLFSLSKNNNIPLPNTPDFTDPITLRNRYTNFKSLDDFISFGQIGIAVLITAADFEALAWSYFEHAAQDNVRHAEIFFDPQSHVPRGVSVETILAGFTAAKERAQREFGITSLLIPCLVRHLSPELGHETYLSLRDDLESQSHHLAGLGISSSESAFHSRLFEQTFRDARERGIRVTAHAGEEGPVEGIACAVRELGVCRIDHGIKLADDEELMAEVARRGILVTMCPISNKKLRCVGDIGDLPVRRFLDAGVRFSINSDNPAYLGGYTLANYRAVQEAFGLTLEECGWIVRHGIEGSWCDAERKEEILREFGAVAQRYSA